MHQHNGTTCLDMLNINADAQKIKKLFAGIVVLGMGKGCVQILNPDSGMKGHVNSNGESLNRPYRLKIARTLGIELRRDIE